MRDEKNCSKFHPATLRDEKTRKKWLLPALRGMSTADF